ncbi:polysaccharide deacetylase family protein [Thauera linaloolentis]|uniref:Glycosyl transferase polysaccharide deacetylase n=1 Tax=Thauera linaloolentis (strain DSM 12138 / JCM 21573 / CCUG 41526 / CIP 105981 / IAM 15112 / NBRC 102519 / 47Lol) TaxID=1123367 RepID=N6ZEJ5_THAL4|nr:polysaccharide deacetylase family protein [Thauera linaloolentis]ENO90594.1 glycosyl transferase polysaccharide deacetylase [Thauera linaloolentis 47Lol = DSM 12138]MCM8566100.1 polysaccharide deacetylase family protein [Thauera linaloolentis]
MLIRTVLSAVSPAGRRARLSILIFHRVLTEPDPLFPGEVDRQRFDELMRWVAGWFNVLPLDEAVGRLERGELPARAAAITFDDGYADNWLNAVPILQQHGLHATFFIATGFLDGGRMWNDTLIESVRHAAVQQIDLSWLGLGLRPLVSVADKRAVLEASIPAIKHMPATQRAESVAYVAEACKAALPDDLMLTSAQLRELRAAGMGVGAHTVSHPILARLDASSACREMAESRDILQGLLNERIGLFAYPNGKPGQDYLPEHVEMARSIGFDAAVSTHWGTSSMGADMFQLRRFTPWDQRRSRFGMRLVRNAASRG